MSLLEKFNMCLDEISRELNLPHLKLDDSNQCKLNYNQALDIQLIWNRANSLQLHSRIQSTNAIPDLLPVLELLLSMNHSDSDMSGGYFGLNKNDRSISYNAIIPLIDVDTVLVRNILTNYIQFSLQMQTKIASELSSIQSQQTAYHTSMNPDLALLMSGMKA